MKYDEQRELLRYVALNQTRVVPMYELFFLKYLGSLKSDNSEHPKLYKKMCDERFPGKFDALKHTFEGLEVAQYQAVIRDKLMRGEYGPFPIARCSRCNAILATPEAQQCLWCGLDWHGKVKPN